MQHSSFPKVKIFKIIILASLVLAGNTGCAQLSPMDALNISQRNLSLQGTRVPTKSSTVSVDEMLVAARASAVGQTDLSTFELKRIMEPGTLLLDTEEAAAIRAGLSGKFDGGRYNLLIVSGPGSSEKSLQSALDSINRARAVAQQINLPGQKVLLRYDPNLATDEIRIRAWPHSAQNKA